MLDNDVQIVRSISFGEIRRCCCWSGVVGGFVLSLLFQVVRVTWNPRPWIHLEGLKSPTYIPGNRTPCGPFSDEAFSPKFLKKEEACQVEFETFHGMNLTLAMWLWQWCMTSYLYSGMLNKRPYKWDKDILACKISVLTSEIMMSWRAK